jgi:hypothetical protein
MTARPLKLAKLTAAEEKAWESAFRFHSVAGKSDTRAANAAWRDLQREFPRLMKYDGARA